MALIAASAGLLVVSASAWANQFTLGKVRSHGYVLSGSGDDGRGDPLMLELVRRGKHSVETVTFTVARAKVRDGGGCSLHVRGRLGRYGVIALTIRPRTSCTEIAPDTSRRAVATGVLVLAIPGGGFTIRLSRLPARVFNQGAACACAPYPPLDLGSLLGAGPLTALLPLQGAVSETYDKVRHPEPRLTIEDQISERGLPRKLFACHGPEFCDGTEAATVMWGGPYFKGTTDFTPGAATGDAGWLTGSVTITSPFAGTTTVLAPDHRLRATIGYSDKAGAPPPLLPGIGTPSG